MKNKSLIKALIFTCVISLSTIILSSCTDNAGTRKTLLRNNYKPISVGGYGWFGGSKGDIFVTKFKAVAPNGDTLTGCVTSGWFKGNTLRTND